MNRLQAFGVGTQTITYWLGAGGEAVPVEIAEARARACVAGEAGKPCRYNQAGTWWDKLAAQTVRTIMAQTRAKSALGLKLPSDDQLHFCTLCHCRLDTKVLVPSEHLLKNTPRELWSELPHWCWLLTERPE